MNNSISYIQSEITTEIYPGKSQMDWISLLYPHYFFFNAKLIIENFKQATISDFKDGLL